MTTAPAGPARSSDKLAKLLDTIELTPFQKQLLRERWLDQVGWMSDRARREQRRYYRLRLPVVILGVAIPVLVSLSLGLAADETFWWLRWITLGLTIVVAILASVEEVFHYGDRWRHYRRNAETLKSLGWQFLMLSGTFSRYVDHAAAFKAFSARVEEILTEDVEGYLGMVDAEGGARHDIIG